jgi:hypothetical protein
MCELQAKGDSINSNVHQTWTQGSEDLYSASNVMKPGRNVRIASTDMSNVRASLDNSNGNTFLLLEPHRHVGSRALKQLLLAMINHLVSQKARNKILLEHSKPDRYFASQLRGQLT